MRLVITTMAWKRYDILTLWCRHIRDLQRELREEVEIIGHVCGSEDEAERISNHFGMEYNYADNMPLGSKANIRIEYARTLKPDAVLFLGSDDFINIDLIRYYIKKLDEGFEEIAPMDIYYIDSINKVSAYSPGYVNHRIGESLAVGRCLKASVLDKLGWKLWNPAVHKGIDGSSRDAIAIVGKKKHTYYLKEKGLMIVDVKNQDSISSFMMRDHWDYCENDYITSLIPTLKEL